jgi:hypothetical protein
MLHMPGRFREALLAGRICDGRELAFENIQTTTIAYRTSMLSSFNNFKP